MSSLRWVGGAVVVLVLAGPAAAVELSPYLPEHAEVVLGAELGPLIDAPVVRKHLPDLLRKHGARWLADFVDMQGPADQIDPVTMQLIKFFLADARANLERLDQLKSTVSRVQLAVHTCDIEERLFLVLQGEFPRQRFQEQIAWIHKTKILGCPIRSFQVGKHEVHCLVFSEEEPTYVALADENHLLISLDRKVLEQALTRGSKQRPVVRKELQEQAPRIDPQSGLWIVMSGEDSPDVKCFHGSLRCGTDVEVQLTVEGINPEETRGIAAYFRDALADAGDALKHLAVDQPGLRPLPDLLRAIQRTEDRQRVSLRLRLEAVTIDRLLLPR